MPPWAYALFDCFERLFRDDQNRKFRIDGIGGPQSGQPAADNQHVGKMMRHPLGMETRQDSGEFYP